MTTLANSHFVDSDITEGTSGATTWQTTTPTTQNRTIAFPQDRSHIEGENVQILDDGVVVADQAITGGVLPSPVTGVYHIGLPYTSTIKPSKLDIEGMGIILVKVITKAIVSFYNTLRGKVGTSATTMQTISFDTSLFTGIKEVPLNGGYDRAGDIIIVQDEPLPMVCRGLVLNTGAHNK